MFLSNLLGSVAGLRIQFDIKQINRGGGEVLNYRQGSLPRIKDSAGSQVTETCIPSPSRAMKKD